MLPASKCVGGEAVRLSAGPVEWLSAVEARVGGTFRKGPGAPVPLVYRVVREAGNWSCLGPIMDYDPL